MQKPTSTSWERITAICAMVALLVSLAASHISCGGEDLFVAGNFPTRTPIMTATPTETPLQ